MPPEQPAPEKPVGRLARLRAAPWWPWLRRAVTLAFFGFVAWLLIGQARTIDWGEVWAGVQRTPARFLLQAVALAVASYAIYSCYDLFGRYFTRHGLPRGTVMLVTFISYAFNLNLGSLVGGVAFRYRLYSRLGLDNGVITRVVTLSMLTNWLGYLALGGAVFAFTRLELPPDWKIDTGGLHWLGGAMLVAAVAYLLACATTREREFSIRGHAFSFPPFKVALLQFLISMLNWALIAGIVWSLLQQRIAYPSVLVALLAAAVAGVITHVPAGLGVLEAVFVALLGHLVPRGELLAALLTYRAIYYLGPLALATLTYFVTESRAKKLAAKTPSPGLQKPAQSRAGA